MNTHNLTIAAYATTGVGLAMMLVNFAFPYVFPDSSAWSDQEADEYADAAAELYRLTHEMGGHDHGDGQTHSPEELARFEAAKQRWEEQENRLNGTLSGQRTLRSVIKWSGILLAVAGGCAAVYLRFGLGDE